MEGSSRSRPLLGARSIGMSGHDRAYRALLRLYPATFRDDYGEEMTRLFREQLRDARASNGRRAVAGLWTHAIADVLETAPGHHLRKEHRVPEPIPAGASSPVVPVPPASPFRCTRLSSGSSLCGCCIIVTLVPHLDFMDPLFANPPSVAGLPAGVFIIAVAMTLMLAGVLLLRRSESDLTTVVAFLFIHDPCAGADLRRSGPHPGPDIPGPMPFPCSLQRPSIRSSPVGFERGPGDLHATRTSG